MIDVKLDRHFETRVMPLHKENREDARSLRGDLSLLRDTVLGFLAELRGKKESEAERDKKNDRRSGWTLTIATVLLVLVGLLTLYVMIHAAQHPSAQAISSDPSIYQGDRQ